MLEYLALGMVLYEPLTGYDVKKEIEAGVGNFYTASYGSLYPALKKLTSKGYLSMTEQQQGSRLKKYYKSTDLGKAEFLEWLSAPLDQSLSIASHMARIYFYDELPVSTRKRLLKEYEAYYQQLLQKYHKMEKRLAKIAMNDEYYEMSTLYLGIQHLQDNIRWLKFIRKQKPLSGFIRQDTAGE